MRYGPQIAKTAFKYFRSLFGATSKGLRPIKRGVQKVMQTRSSPAGEVKNVAGIKRFASGKLEPFGKSHSKIKVEGGGKTIIDKTAKEGLQKTGSRVEVVRNVALGVGTGQVAVAGYQKKSAKDKKKTAEVLAERESKPLVKDAPPLASSKKKAEVPKSKPKQAITNLKGAKTHFNKWFHKKYAEVGEGATADYTDPITGETRPILMTHGKGKSQPGTAKKPSKSHKGGYGLNIAESKQSVPSHTGGYGLNIAPRKLTPKAAWDRENLGQKITGYDRSGANTSGLQSFQTGLLEGDRGYITEARSKRGQEKKRKEHSMARKRILALRLTGL